MFQFWDEFFNQFPACQFIHKVLYNIHLYNSWPGITKVVTTLYHEKTVHLCDLCIGSQFCIFVISRAFLYLVTACDIWILEAISLFIMDIMMFQGRLHLTF